MPTWMKRFSILALFGLALFAAPFLKGEQGYVLISLGNWTLEGSIVSSVTALLIISALLYALWLVIKYVIFFVILPSKWWQQKSEKTHANFYQNGLDYMALGLWQMAAQEFLKVKRPSKKQSAAELALVCAARANDPELVNQLQQQNIDITERQISQLIVLCQQQQYQDASALLATMSMQVLKQPLPFQQLWLEIQIRTFNWEAVGKHLLKLNNLVHKNASLEIQKEWQYTISQQFSLGFNAYLQQESIHQLIQVWNSWSKGIHKLTVVADAYIEVLAKHKLNTKIEHILLEQKKAHPNAWLMNNIRRCYKLIGRTHMDKLFLDVQKLIAKDPENKELLTVYGYLAAGQKDAELAKQALEQVIYSNNNPDDFTLYANVLAELGEVRKAVEVYQSL